MKDIFIHQNENIPLLKSPFYKVLTETLKKESCLILSPYNIPISIESNTKSLSIEDYLLQTYNATRETEHELWPLILETALEETLNQKPFLNLKKAPGVKKSIETLYRAYHTHELKKSEFTGQNNEALYQCIEKINTLTQKYIKEGLFTTLKKDPNKTKLKNKLSQFQNAFLFLLTPLLPYEETILKIILKEIPNCSIFEYKDLNITLSIEDPNLNIKHLQIPSKEKKTIHTHNLTQNLHQNSELLNHLKAGATLHTAPNTELTLQIKEAKLSTHLQEEEKTLETHPLYHFISGFLTLLKEDVEPVFLSEWISNPFARTLHLKNKKISINPYFLNKIASDLYIYRGLETFISSLKEFLYQRTRTKREEEELKTYIERATALKEYLETLLTLKNEASNPLKFPEVLEKLLLQFKVQELLKEELNIKVKKTIHSLKQTYQKTPELLDTKKAIQGIKNALKKISLSEKKDQHLFQEHQTHCLIEWGKPAKDVPLTILAKPLRNKLKNNHSPLIKLYIMAVNSTLHWFTKEKKTLPFITLVEKENIEKNKKENIITPTYIKKQKEFIFKKEESLKEIKKELENKTFSVTQLENYQYCQQKYFFKYVLKVETEDPFTDEISKASIGTLVHYILKRWIEEFTPLNSKEKRLKQIAEEEFEKYPKDHFFFDLAREDLLGNEYTEGLFKNFLQEEAENPYPLTPIHCEKEFELETPIKLKGSIDLILKEGLNLAVLDYKTGKNIPKITDIKELRSLQLPLYIIATEELYPDDYVIGGIIYKLSKDNCEKMVLCCTKDSKQEIFNLGRKRPLELTPFFLQEVKEHIQNLYEEMKKGNFSTTPFENTKKTRLTHCSYCEYQLYCTFEDRFKGYKP